MNREAPKHWDINSSPPVAINWYGLEMKDAVQGGDQVYNFVDTVWADAKELGLAGGTVDYRYVIRALPRPDIAEPAVKKGLSNEEFLNHMEGFVK